MSYLKGKDIKVPFDCLWYYYTRKFEPFHTSTNPENSYLEVDSLEAHHYIITIPEEFEKW